MEVQAAAISLQGSNFVVVLVAEELVSSGEGDMAIESMQAKFGGVPVVLMSQRDDGSPVYFGEQDLVQSLRDVPVEKMPWKNYQL